MFGIGGLVKISLGNIIQTASIGVLTFGVYVGTIFGGTTAQANVVDEWSNTRIREEVVYFETSIGDAAYNVSEAEMAGLLREMEIEAGGNVDVISPEAQLLIDIKEQLGGEIGIACVDSYVNVRVEPSADSEATAKIYNSSVVFIQEPAGDWMKIKSGNAEGYVKSEFFLMGDYMAKQILMDEPYTREELVEDKSFTLGITLEEEEAIRLAKEEEERKERERIAAEQEAARKQAMAAGNDYSYSNTSELRKQIVDFATSYVGLKYVMGGNSLVTGTDCSGFTKLVYGNFGYGIDRTPAGQFNNNGRLVSYADAQPGDYFNIIMICNIFTHFSKTIFGHILKFIGKISILF